MDEATDEGNAYMDEGMDSNADSPGVFSAEQAYLDPSWLTSIRRVY